MTASRSVINIVFAITQGVILCNGAAWYLLGLFWRFSRGGRIASGEKLVRGDGVDKAAWKEELKTLSEKNGY